jgi:hypothetical protein
VDIARRGEQVLCRRRRRELVEPQTAIALDFLDRCLGGADDDKNLWPEPRHSIEKE